MLVETIFKIKNIQLFIIIKFSERNEIVSIVCHAMFKKFKNFFFRNSLDIMKTQSRVRILNLKIS